MSSIGSAAAARMSRQPSSASEAGSVEVPSWHSARTANSTQAVRPPAHIDVEGYDIAKLPQFTKSGALTPAAQKEDAKRIDWQALAQEFNHVKEKFSDMHCHMHNYTGAGHVVADAIAAMFRLGIRRTTLIPIPTTLVSADNDKKRYYLYKGKSHHCGENYYVPAKYKDATDLSPKMLAKIQKSVELRVDASVDDNLAAEVEDALISGKIEPEHLDKIDLALTGIHLGSPRVTKDILKTLWRMKKTNAGLQAQMAQQGKDMQGQRLRFTHIGEVTLRKELVETLFAGKTQAHLKDNIAPTREAMRLAGVIGMPWILHCDVDTPESLKSKKEKNKDPVNLEDVKALMRSCPNTEIIWAHAGGLGRFVKAGKNHVQHMRDLMDDPTLQHVKLDISWSHVAAQITANPETTKEWAEFLCKYDDRIIFGSDTLTPQTEKKWTETYDIYQEKLMKSMEKIKPGAAKKIMLTNYDNVMLPARKRVDAFVDHVLPVIIPGILHFAGVENVDVKAIQNERNKIFKDIIKKNIDSNDPAKKQMAQELKEVYEYYVGRETDDGREGGRDAALPEFVPPADWERSKGGAATKWLKKLGKAFDFKHFTPGRSSGGVEGDSRRKQDDARRDSAAAALPQSQQGETGRPILVPEDEGTVLNLVTPEELRRRIDIEIQPTLARLKPQ